jgi:Bax protein
MKPHRVALLLVLAIAAVIVIHRFSTYENYRSYAVRAETIRVDSLSQVELLNDSLVKPLLYTHVSGLDQLEVAEAKKIFISVLLPSILVAKHKVKEDSIKIQRLKRKKRWSKVDSAFYLDMKQRFKATSLDNLIPRMGSLPNSVVLAQAAVETGWGQSRFFLEGNNVFGVWSYNTDEPRMKASISREDNTIYVKVYDNISESIFDYFEIIGSARAYRGLRRARMETNNPFELLPHLKYYSEGRSLYTDRLKALIRQNSLTRYDHYHLDPRFLILD